MNEDWAFPRLVANLWELNYDLRFMIEADPEEPLVISSESKDLAWVELSRVTALNSEESMARMVRKTLRE